MGCFDLGVFLPVMIIGVTFILSFVGDEQAEAQVLWQWREVCSPGVLTVNAFGDASCGSQ